VGDIGQGITGTALVCASTTEGVSVRKPAAGQGNDNGNPRSQYDSLTNLR
jgi:hypothetical protein